MKKLIIILSTLIMSITCITASMSLFIENKTVYNINNQAVYNHIQNNLKEFSITLRDENYFNYNFKLEPSQLALYVEFTTIYVEEKIDTIANFYVNSNGNYVRINGEYIEISSRRKYSYINGRYISDNDGKYIYLNNHKWARTEEEKYIAVDNFYSKIIDQQSNYKMSLRGYYQIIDTQNSFVLKSGLIDNNITTTNPSNFDTLVTRGLNKINYQYQKLYEEKPTIAIYIEDSPVNYFLIDQIYNQIRNIFEKEERYTVYDRNNLEKLFEELKIDMVTPGTEMIASQLKNVEYLIIAKLNTYNENAYNNTEKYFFNDPFYGDYIRGNRVIPKTFYEIKRNDKGETEYVISSEGNYVQIEKNVWDRKENYIIFSNPQTLIEFPTTYKYGNLGFSYKVIDLKNQEILFENSRFVENNIKFIELKDIHESTTSKYSSDLYETLITRAVSNLENEINRVFKIEGLVIDKNIEKELVQIDVGKNYGVGRNSYYVIKDGIITAAHGQVRRINEFDSELKIVQTYTDYAQYGIDNKAVEDFDYSKPLNISLSLYLKNYTDPGIKFSYRNKNIENVTNYMIGAGLSFNMNIQEEPTNENND